MSFKVVIPARYASSRLPAKPLLDIAGKPMVLHVVEKAKASLADQVVVATDHADILEAVTGAGYECVMTAEHHQSGTDRIAEVARIYGWSAETIVVNVQGDEPLIDPTVINLVAQNLVEHPMAEIATVCHAISFKSEMINPNVVKVVMDRHGYAMYFSRAPIPYPRDSFANVGDLDNVSHVFRHVGVYAYKTSFLTTYASLDPAPIERLESLEQLRAMWHGYKISVACSEHPSAIGVDTEDDLIHVRAILGAK